ncbi:ABC transporter substrate-binding protein [Microlunatus endophyticus]|uniref:ABC transporter substrate-binding protein n=1 Tax=Microlunatus endophyticus TaxID=1716077 RepID=A0A917W1F3_9ACTN|nr:ABC transporter substrate-binding protein [Microlunatus endophyticus]GGL56055.1 ABC transporter substrate-binding protein [Microlunatus endophyticus]
MPLAVQTTADHARSGIDTEAEFAEIVDQLTRRGLLVGGLGGAALFGLAGCGDRDRPAGTRSPAAVMISHEYGTTQVPGHPERVATVGYNDQDFVLALGIVPVTTRGWYENYNRLPWVQQATRGKGVADTAGSAEINYEALAATHPDVILALYEDIDRPTYQKLSAIAPTVVKGAKYPADTIPWRDELLLTGKALGRESEARTLLARVEAKINTARKEHPEFAGTVLVVDYGPENGGHWLVPAGDPRRALFDDLGFAAQSTGKDVSAERVDLLDRDILFVEGATKRQMLAAPAFARLSVVTQGRTLYTGFDSRLSAALSYDGPQALLYALDILVPQLANALAGRPVANLDEA